MVDRAGYECAQMHMPYGPVGIFCHYAASPMRVRLFFLRTFSVVIWALLYATLAWLTTASKFLGCRACPCSEATIFAPFVFRFLLNRYVASEGLGEAGSS